MPGPCNLHEESQADIGAMFSSFLKKIIFELKNLRLVLLKLCFKETK